ncbi:MAG: polysaccharide deacetylase family protein [Maritimibacter sp.]
MIGRGAQATRAMALPDRMAPMFPSHMPHRHMPHRHTIRILPQPGQALALTFDDGPHHTNTPAMLDVLKAHDVRATFFVVGHNAERFPDILKRMVDEGHEIGNHSYSHSDLREMEDAAILDEIDRTAEAVHRATGHSPILLRPPYGRLHDAQRDMIAEARGLSTVLWSVDPEDWRDPGADLVAERITAAAEPRAIVLGHDTKPGTVEAMPHVLAGLSDIGLRCTTISMGLEQIDWASL